MLTDGSARAKGLGSEFGRYPSFEREKRLLQPAFEAKYPVHGPSEFIATTDTDRLSILKIGR